MNDKTITLNNYIFKFVNILNPECDLNGKIISYSPQERYNNKKQLPLNKNGEGSFCKFKLAIEPISGVYLWVADNQIIYIGEASNLSKRFNMGYGNISPKNCFKNGQSTNCKMNKIVKEYYEKNILIEIYAYYTKEYKKIEKELIIKYSPKFNVKNNN